MRIRDIQRVKKTKYIFLFLCLSSFLFGVDMDFDGVEDDVDLCLATSMLETVNAQGCSENQLKQSKGLEFTLLQTYSSLSMKEESRLDNYSLAFMINSESWLFYLGSGYFKYDTLNSGEKSLGDTTLLVQKRWRLSSSHYLKSSFSMILPTYDSEGNNLDYGVDLGYMFLYNDFSFELDYQYNSINDTNIDNLGVLYTYMGYNFNDLTTLLGYSLDSEDRESYNLLLQYTLSEQFSLSYSLSQGNKNFYDTMHSVGFGYNF